ncbi:MAG: winged helix-turn-helix transcriptional regulator [Gammaproteobacteria bacterium]|nr:winged helix-turn-helix transcriptional regulator [Gammaproteobacteria bacterium]
MESNIHSQEYKCKQIFKMAESELTGREQTQVRMTVLLGIIQQLMTTRQNRFFEGRELTLSQFGVLNHFTHAPERSWTVTDLVDVMEMNQPGITKIVTVLIDKGLLSSTLDQSDKRKRYLKITPKGLGLCRDTFRSLLPEISQVFGDWDDHALKQFHQHLEKLMRWLDSNRLND